VWCSQPYHQHGTKSMMWMWIAFAAGIMVGTVVGVVVVALCQMMSRDREHRTVSGHPECQCDSLRPPLPLRNAKRASSW
jgi:hypothetical protein